MGTHEGGFKQEITHTFFRIKRKFIFGMFSSYSVFKIH